MKKTTTLLTLAALAFATAARAEFLVRATTMAYEDQREQNVRSAISSTSNALAQAIADAQPADYATVSNLAHSALQSYTETDPTIYSWAKAASKPSYTPNEIFNAATNWIGAQGNAGRIIKILAGTVASTIVGGYQITGSTLNDNNMTTYAYGGVAVKRDGVNDDYLWSTTATNGIVRRKELTSATNKLAQAIAASISDVPIWGAVTNTATIGWNYGCEVVNIASGATLAADTTGWKDGEQVFVVLKPQGAYSVGAGLTLSGYGLWPTNETQCIAWKYQTQVYVTPIRSTP